jgi:hypothetical protein
MMMHDKSNSDSKPIDLQPRKMRSAGLSARDHEAMIKAVWSLADCPVLRLFADTAPIQRELIH